MTHVYITLCVAFSIQFQTFENHLHWYLQIYSFILVLDIIAYCSISFNPSPIDVHSCCFQTSNSLKMLPRFFFPRRENKILFPSCNSKPLIPNLLRELLANYLHIRPFLRLTSMWTEISHPRICSILMAGQCRTNSLQTILKIHPVSRLQ